MLRYWEFRPKSGLSTVGSSHRYQASLEKPAPAFSAILTLGVIKVESSDCWEFQFKLGLLTYLTKILCSDLVFWIPIRTIRNSSET